MAGVHLKDADTGYNRLVETPVAYRDKRTEGMQDKWRNLMPDLDTFERTGINFYIFNTLFQLLSAKDSKALQRTSRILFVSPAMATPPSNH